MNTDQKFGMALALLAVPFGVAMIWLLTAVFGAPSVGLDCWRREDRGEQQDRGHAEGEREERERDAELLVGVHHRACWGLGRRSVSNEDASRCAPALRSHIGRAPDERERLAPAPAAPVNSLALIETG